MTMTDFAVQTENEIRGQLADIQAMVNDIGIARDECEDPESGIDELGRITLALQDILAPDENE